MSHHLLTVVILGPIAVFLIVAIVAYCMDVRWAKWLMVAFGCLMLLPLLLPLSGLVVGVRGGRPSRTISGDSVTNPKIYARLRPHRR